MNMQCKDIKKIIKKQTKKLTTTSRIANHVHNMVMRLEAFHHM